MRTRIVALLALCGAATGCADAVLAAPPQPRPAASLDGMLATRVASAGQVVQGPGTRIRVCRLGGDGSGPPALVLVDGRRFSSVELAAIDPGDIAEVNIYKGPAAVSAYGPAAAHGVIVVTTRAAAAR
jgi:TonB-dependent SusC/RagA subfamily outer membrane receptor